MTDQAAVESALHDLPKSRSPHWLRWPRLTGTGSRILLVAAAVSAITLGAFGIARISLRASPSLEDLTLAINAAVDKLAASPAVQGVQESYIGEYLASATWFDWRRNGSALVVQRVDADVAESGWWAAAEGDPPRIGANITTTARVLVNGTLYEATQSTRQPAEHWSSMDLQDAPRGALALGIAVLTDDSWALDLGTSQAAEVSRTTNLAGETTWTLSSAALGGTLVQRWDVAVGGELRNWSFEYANVENVAALPEPITAGQLTFHPVARPEPIEAPAEADEPSLADFDLPPDFPMQDQ
jgi:hypothetical protein